MTRGNRPHDVLGLETLRADCEAAEFALAGTIDDQQALDEGLERLRAAVGPDLVCCVFVREHDRLWLIAERGYDQALAVALEAGSLQPLLLPAA